MFHTTCHSGRPKLSFASHFKLEAETLGQAQAQHKAMFNAQGQGSSLV